MSSQNINFGLPPPPGASKDQFYDGFVNTGTKPNSTPVAFNGRDPLPPSGRSNANRPLPQRRSTTQRVAFEPGTPGDTDRAYLPKTTPIPHPGFYPTPGPHSGSSPATFRGSPLYSYNRYYASPAASGHAAGSSSSPYYSHYSSNASPYYSHSRYIGYTTTSTETGSNLPGAGRTLGLLISFLGKKLEAFLNTMAMQLGYGPDAVALRLEKAVMELALDQGAVPGRFGSLSTRKRYSKNKQLRKECERLLEYASSAVYTTQIAALTRLLQLASIIPEHPDRHIALISLMEVHAQQGVVTLRKLLEQRKRHQLYSPEEYAMLRNLLGDLGRALPQQ